MKILNLAKILLLSNLKNTSHMLQERNSKELPKRARFSSKIKLKNNCAKSLQCQ